MMFVLSSRELGPQSPDLALGGGLVDAHDAQAGLKTFDRSGELAIDDLLVDRKWLQQTQKPLACRPLGRTEAWASRRARASLD